MTLTIYGTPNSRAIRPLWTAEELGIRYANVPLHHASKEVKAPEYLRLNPNGAVPVIDDDGTIVFESLAIDLYLAKKHADRGLTDLAHLRLPQPATFARAAYFQRTQK